MRGMFIVLWMEERIGRIFRAICRTLRQTEWWLIRTTRTRFTWRWTPGFTRRLRLQPVLRGTAGVCMGLASPMRPWLRWLHRRALRRAMHDWANCVRRSTDRETYVLGVWQIPLLTAATPAAPLMTLSPVSLTFATQAVATASPAQTITVTNSGNAPLTVTQIVA